MNRIAQAPPAWLLCPQCGKKTRTQVREHTVLEDFPLFCPKCKFQGVIAFRQGKIQQMTPYRKDAIV